MRIFLFLFLVLPALSAQAQLYKWTDADGRVHYSDRVQHGVNATEIKARPPANARPATDNWREREQESRRNRAIRAATGGDTAAMERRGGSAREPFNPSMNRSSKPMTDDEVCERDRQQIEYAEQAPRLSMTHGTGGSRQLSEAERREVVSERKANHALTCGSGRRR
jgi:hypothetical protein